MGDAIMLGITEPVTSTILEIPYHCQKQPLAVE